jgi:hypothetical protein
MAIAAEASVDPKFPARWQRRRWWHRDRTWAASLEESGGCWRDFHRQAEFRRPEAPAFLG